MEKLSMKKLTGPKKLSIKKLSMKKLRGPGPLNLRAAHGRAKIPGTNYSYFKKGPPRGLRVNEAKPKRDGHRGSF